MTPFFLDILPEGYIYPKENRYFAEPGVLETFMRDYRRILIQNFQKIIIEGGGEF